MSIVTLVNGLVDHVQNGSYSQPVHVENSEFLELGVGHEQITLYVYPFESAEQKGGRGDCTEVIHSVAMLLVHDMGELLDRDAMITLAEEIRAYVRFKKFDNYNWIGTDVEVLWDRDLLRENNIFTNFAVAGYKRIE